MSQETGVGNLLMSQEAGEVGILKHVARNRVTEYVLKHVARNRSGLLAEGNIVPLSGLGTQGKGIRVGLLRLRPIKHVDIIWLLREFNKRDCGPEFRDPEAGLRMPPS